MKAYKVTLLVVDHDGVGSRIPETIENQKFPNYCISPKVIEIQEAEIGQWHDDHPLNFKTKQSAEVGRLFGNPLKAATLAELPNKKDQALLSAASDLLEACKFAIFCLKDQAEGVATQMLQSAIDKAEIQH